MVGAFNTVLDNELRVMSLDDKLVRAPVDEPAEEPETEVVKEAEEVDALSEKDAIEVDVVAMVSVEEVREVSGNRLAEEVARDVLVETTGLDIVAGWVLLSQ